MKQKIRNYIQEEGGNVPIEAIILLGILLVLCGIAYAVIIKKSSKIVEIMND